MRDDLKKAMEDGGIKDKISDVMGKLEGCMNGVSAEEMAKLDKTKEEVNAKLGMELMGISMQSASLFGIDPVIVHTVIASSICSMVHSGKIELVK